ncbi:LOW QUALITY PROTEIN: Fanconi anemia group J protein homolog [Pollicipes pollicipes]|uniref:LOW QUALITY PROTEIN: Fanconi anemia group J protein homolog n=1 Tax=Pollicipes pollicipes TaxID=41117 RepID=UPI0018850EF5|nr:LOW QUALITY PROTEIN: Fanconi anemia group J protein homolog [Pollicipes pollicipes]
MRGWGDDDLEDFETKGTKRLRASLPGCDVHMAEPEPEATSPSAGEKTAAHPAQQSSKKRLKRPKIYFGTRTHRQLAQITQELRRTSYKHVRMTVLASREHACIHPIVSRSANKNDGCRELRDRYNQEGCGFFSGASQRLHHPDQLAALGLEEAWPLEELVAVGRRIRACPYYGARNLKEAADIVFCPYNYLVEPGIRESLEINLQNQVLILDEAHNIEDSSREAASQTFQQAHIQDAIRDLEKCGSGGRKTQAECRDMARMLSHISQWMDRHSDKLDQYREFDRSSKILTGTDMVAHFTSMGIGYDAFPELRASFTALMGEELEAGEEALRQQQHVQRLTSGTTALLGSLLRELGFIYGENMKHRDDFRIALVRSMARQQTPSAQGGWQSARPRAAQPAWALALHFWCLNPAVVFAPIGQAAHSVIVASGTLSPLSSFESELGVPFRVKLEASHVIAPEQVYVAAISHGPQGGSMNATYRSSEQFSFQDELGGLVLGVCAAIPNGVLCFFPSYSMLDKLARRWRATGLWERLEARKPVLCEPRRSGDFSEMMREFRHLVDGDEAGALLLAVCRGKLSEGIDFSDDSARAVITVGIPYPNVKDIQVDLKKLYNTAHASSRGLLSGHEWYGIQAYRALNQALGRCIRHRYDWGAILLVDDRFGRPRGLDGLSRWLRSLVRQPADWLTVAGALRQFAADMKLWSEEQRRQRQADATEAASLVASAAVVDAECPKPFAASIATPPMSPASDRSPGPTSVVGIGQFQYTSPRPGGAKGGQQVLCLPVSKAPRVPGAPSQEIVTVNGARFLRLTDQGQSRLVPLLTPHGVPAAAVLETGPASPATGDGADQEMTLPSAEKRPRRSSSSPGEPAPEDAARAPSPVLFGDGEGANNTNAVQPVSGRRPMFRPGRLADRRSQAETQSPEVVRKTLLTAGCTARARPATRRTRGVIFISSDEED